MTYRQAQAAGAQVRKGAHGTPIIFFSPPPGSVRGTGTRRRPCEGGPSMECVFQCDSTESDVYGIAGAVDSVPCLILVSESEPPHP